MINDKVRSDLETCAEILEVADLSKRLDLQVVALLSGTLCKGIPIKEYELAEITFEYARHGLIKLFFKLFIKLRESVIAGEEVQTHIFSEMLGF
jgi:hypothetical protein